MNNLDQMHGHTLRGALEAMLLVSTDPVSATALAKVLGLAPGEVAAALADLSAEYADAERGFQLREVAGGWRLFTHPAYHDEVESLVMSWDTRKLSQAALETLAVIAYHQPVSREGVRAVRGVNSDGVVSSLVDKGLVREVGRERGKAGAVLYGTTQAFLERFGLASVKDLPPLEDFAPDEQAREFIRERLSGKSMESVLEEVDEDLEEASELAMSDEAAEALAVSTGAELDGVALAERLAVEEGDVQGALDALLEVALDAAEAREASGAEDGNE